MYDEALANVLDPIQDKELHLQRRQKTSYFTSEVHCINDILEEKEKSVKSC